MSDSPGSSKRMSPLIIGAIGVVYGDIGTSPLYTLRQCFGGEHMMLEGGEIHDSAILEDGRHPVADALLGVRRRRTNGGANVVQDLLDLMRKLLDVLVDVGGGFHACGRYFMAAVVCNPPVADSACRELTASMLAHR